MTKNHSVLNMTEDCMNVFQDERNELNKDVISFRTNRFQYYEIRKLLVNVYMKKFDVPGLTVSRFFAVDECYSYFKFMTVYKDFDDYYDTNEHRLFAEINYAGNRYFANFFVIREDYLSTFYVIFNYLKNSIPCMHIGEKLFKISVKYCPSFKNRIVETKVDGNSSDNLCNLEINDLDVEESSLDRIFVNDKIKEDIQRFIYAFKNFDKYRISQRYMLSGKPGLGKTEIIRAAISQCRNYGTVIVPANTQNGLHTLFEFAEMISPALVCIDDIDLFLGIRDNNYNNNFLHGFLGYLDSILQNNVFLLATTNDKKLVDMAASRPGRFDMIVDIGDFQRSDYLPFIENLTGNEKIRSLFDDDVMGLMEEKKVSGAFIKNVVKQLSVLVDVNPDFNGNDLYDFVKRIYDGFAGSQITDKCDFGFVA